LKWLQPLRQNMLMKDFVRKVLGFLEQEKPDYADVRVVSSREEGLTVKNGQVDSLSIGEDTGFGVRVFINGFMGFSSSNRLTPDETERVVRHAAAMARAAAMPGGKTYELAHEGPATGTYATPVTKDPFTVPTEEKIGLLLEVDEALSGEESVKLRISHLRFIRDYKIFADTRGSFTEQTIYHTGAGYTAFAMGDGALQQRSYPASHGGNMCAGGWEFVEGLDLLAHAERVASEAAGLLKAPPGPEGEMDMVVGTHQMALQVHESIGHALELDRVLGYEASYAGTSFATTEKLGNFRYGSPLLNIVADTRTPGGLGTFGWDDEGTSARTEPLVKDGILVNYLSSKDTSPTIGKPSTAAARASSWSRIPIVRMVNVSMLPGDKSFEDLLAMVDDGIFVDTNRSWSIDQKRLNFQFGTEIGYRIRKGKLAEMVRNPIYSDITPKFWAKLTAMGKDWELWGVPNCGKGEPGQTMRVGHGTNPSLFRGVRVGNAG
jgi:TldD protein